MSDSPKFIVSSALGNPAYRIASFPVMNGSMFQDGWVPIARIAVVGTLSLILLVLQRTFAALSIHIGWFGRYLKAQPLLVVYRGVILWKNARKEQLGDLEILGGIRSNGVAAVEDVLAMVLEPDGTFSVVPLSAQSGDKLPTALRDVRGVPEFELEQKRNDEISKRDLLS